LLNSRTSMANDSAPMLNTLRLFREGMETWLVDNSARQSLKGLLMKVEIATN
jgi:hypothetical protein